MDLATLWNALQAVDDGEDPADVYARVTNETIDPDTIAELAAEYEADAIAEDHPHEPCRQKHADTGICMGNECTHRGGAILTTQCPCKCHEDGYPWN